MDEHSNDLDPREARGEIASHLKGSLRTLSTLRDEVRVVIHLASLEARKRWAALSAQLDRTEHEAKQRADDVAARAVDEAIVALDAFRRAIVEAREKRSAAKKRPS